MIASAFDELRWAPMGSDGRGLAPSSNMLALTACKCSPRRALPSSQVLAGTAGALRNLTVTDEIAKHIALAGGLEALIAAAEAHPESAEVQSEAAGALWGLAITEEIAEAICAKGGIKVLTTALTKAGAAHLDMRACAHHGAIPPAPGARQGGRRAPRQAARARTCVGRAAQAVGQLGT